ncbi:MAG: cyclic nucleotide-binding domain-containing protein [Wenzhouxiangella sp.]
MNESIDAARLKDSFLGEELSNEDIEALEGVLTTERVPEGEFLVREDDADRRLFLLAEGKLEVLNNQRGELRHIYTMEPGEFAGTRAFIDGHPRAASLRAKADSVVYCLEPGDFERLLDTRPWLVYKIMRAIFRITHLNLMRMNREARELANYVYKIGGRY